MSRYHREHPDEPISHDAFERLPKRIPIIALPPKDCKNCLFQHPDWKDDGFCYMFQTEPAGDTCGQFKNTQVTSAKLPIGGSGAV